MDSTNHNAWTLTKHVAVSINKAAGKLDVHIYGGNPVATTNTIVPAIDAPSPPVFHEERLQLLLIIVALGVLAGIWIRKYNKRSEDRVARSIFWWR